MARNTICNRSLVLRRRLMTTAVSSTATFRRRRFRDSIPACSKTFSRHRHEEHTAYSSASCGRITCWHGDLVATFEESYGKRDERNKRGFGSCAHRGEKIKLLARQCCGARWKQ